MSKSKAVSEVQTDGKSFIVMREDQGSLYRIGLEGGGVIPTDLSGRYTSVHAAEVDIAKYLSTRS